MSAKYKVGNLVEFSQSSYNDDEEYNQLDVVHRYKEGQKGYVKSAQEGDDGYVYKIQVGLTDIIDVPESHIFDPNLTARTKVEERLREKQETKTFRDTEGRIGGSKKEKAAWRLVQGQVYTLDDLDKIEEADEKLAIELIKKDTVYPKVDVASEREKGVGSGAAFLKVKLRESYPSKVPPTSAKRKIYVGFAEYIYKKTVDVFTTKDFNNFVGRALLNEAIGEFIKILKPDIVNKIESERESNEKNLKIATEKKEKLELERTKEQERLNAKYPELISQFYPYFDYMSLPEHDRTYILELDFEIADVWQESRKYSNTWTEIEKDFLQNVLNLKSLYDKQYVAKQLIKEIFGSTFLNFVTSGSEAAQKNYVLAADYDALSETESEILISEEIEPYLKSIKKRETEIDELKQLVSELEYDYFFNYESGRGNTGYHQSIFGESYRGKGKWYYYKDLKSKEYKKLYANRYLKHIERVIVQDNKTIAEIQQKYRVRENDWSWYSSEKTPVAKEKSKDKIRVNTYPPLLNIKRTGGYLITEDNLTPTTVEKDGIKFNEYPVLKNNFGFKDVEFGQSLKDREAKEHVRHFLAAIADLADILDINIKKLNQLGGLSIAFASRGGGKASAHYEPLRRVINITKTRGGGAVAHEYMHFLDNFIPSINRAGYTHGDWASVKDSTLKKWYGSTVMRRISNEDVSKAVSNIFRYIDDRQMPNDNGGSSETGKRATIKKTIPAYKGDKNWHIPTTFIADTTGSYQSVLPNDIDEYIIYFKKRYSQYKYIEKLSKKDKEILGTIVTKFGFEEYEFEFETKSSQFLANSVAMGDYWSRDWELFARAFETYIYDKLAKADRANTYLVAGFYFDSEYGVYPAGEERENLFILYDKFIDTIKEAYDLDGFVSWTTERVDEYFEIDAKTDKEDGVVVDDETDEVVEEAGEANPLKAKLRELLTILDEEKMELGGGIENSEYFDKLNDYLITL
jgi:hypothetical protein